MLIYKCMNYKWIAFSAIALALFVQVMSAGAIKEKIEAYSYGDITGVTITTAADSGLTGGGVGTSGDLAFTLVVGTIDGGEYSL